MTHRADAFWWLNCARKHTKYYCPLIWFGVSFVLCVIVTWWVGFYPCPSCFYVSRLPVKIFNSTLACVFTIFFRTFYSLCFFTLSLSLLLRSSSFSTCLHVVHWSSLSPCSSELYEFYFREAVKIACLIVQRSDKLWCSQLRLPVFACNCERSGIPMCWYHPFLYSCVPPHSCHYLPSVSWPSKASLEHSWRCWRNCCLVWKRWVIEGLDYRCLENLEGNLQSFF